MMWAKILVGYHIQLHIFKGSSVTAVRYRDEVLDPIANLYVGVLISSSWIIISLRIEPTLLMSTWLLFLVWRGRHIPPDLNSIEIFSDALEHTLSACISAPAS